MSNFEAINGLPLHVIYEAACLLFEIRENLHVVEASSDGVLFAVIANAQLADRMAVCGACADDDEDDGTAEFDHRLSPFVEALFEPAPCQGHPVPSWSAPSHQEYSSSGDTEFQPIFAQK